MKKHLAYYENEWPANIAELTAIENKPFVGYLKGTGVQFTVIPAPIKLQPNNEIWYTTSDGLIHEFDDTYIDANLVSNTYKDGLGIAVFDKDITKISSEYAISRGGGYIHSMIKRVPVNEYVYTCNLITISLPDSLIEIENFGLSYGSNWVQAAPNCSIKELTLGPNVKFIGAYKQDNSIINGYGIDKINFKGTLNDWVNIQFGEYYDEDECIYLFGFKQLVINNIEIKDLNIPEGTTNINNYSFFGCKNINSIIIPSSVTSIGASAFKSDLWIMKNNIINNSSLDAKANNYWGAKVCDEITEDGLYILDSIVIAADLDKINKNGSVIVPEGVTEIEYGMFMSSGLKNITIPASVVRIGADSFSWLSDFSITYLGTKDQWSKVENYAQWTNESNDWYMTIHCIDGDVIQNTESA